MALTEKLGFESDESGRAFFDKHYIGPIDLESPVFPEAVLNGIYDKGLVTISEMSSKDQLEALARVVGKIRVHKATGNDGTTIFTTRPGERQQQGVSTADYELYPHTDGTRFETPASFLALYVQQPDTDGGGKSIFVDGAKLYTTIKEQDPELLAFLKTPILFGTSGDQFLGPVFSQTEAGLIAVRFRLDDQVVIPDPVRGKLGRFLAIPGMQHEVGLRAGEGFLADNRRMLHGRTEIKGIRSVQRANIDAPPPLYRQLGFRR